MQPINTVGAVVKQGGVVLSTSLHCAVTGQRFDGAAVTSPVDSQSGLYMRIAASVHRQMTPDQYKQAIARVIMWYEDQRQPDQLEELTLPDDDPGESED